MVMIKNYNLLGKSLTNTSVFNIIIIIVSFKLYGCHNY